MKIAILDLTRHPEPLLTGLRRASHQILDWLAPAFKEADFTIYDIAETGEPLPALAAFDGLILSGSELGVYDDAAWMSPLRALLTSTKQVRKPIFGICFGHQIMADTFGGKAEKAEGGNVIGVRDFTDDQGRSFPAYVWHQDQVTELPPGASVVAMASYCPMAVLRYDFPAFSVQYHPEFNPPFITGLLTRGRDHFVDGKLADAAWHEVLEQPVNEHLNSHQVAAFFRDNHSYEA